MEEAAGGRVLLELPGVSIPTRIRQGALQGRLRVRLAADDVVLEWEPLEEPWDPPDDTPAPPGEAEDPPDPGYEPDWAVLSPPRAPPQPPGCRGGFRLALRELRGLRRSPPGLHRPFVVLLPRGGGAATPLHFPRGGPRKLLRLLGPRLRPCPQDPRLLLVVTPQDPGPDPPPLPPSPGLVTRLLQGPVAATVGGLSRLLGGARSPHPGEEPEPPFEVISCVTLGPRPAPPRAPPVTLEEWGRGHDPEGRTLDPAGLRERIFRGGLSPPVRPQAWERLLGLRGWGGHDPRERSRRGDYFRMKLQWRSLSPGQQRRNSAFQRYRQRLERDLDRSHPDVTDPERALLRDILLTYCMYHFDLGYVGGMSEILTPLLTVTPEEVGAFWGFCSLMEMVLWAGPGGAEAATGATGSTGAGAAPRHRPPAGDGGAPGVLRPMAADALPVPSRGAGDPPALGGAAVGAAMSQLPGGGDLRSPGDDRGHRGQRRGQRRR
ncbi:TBC1 domain family member 17-like isoform X2 [Cuculus canorus]|uniref:TBC1 domain family member 17-like isoform X2 n=1 Tax=Cuculus canorus TaxID=55661 RepID=UPI0023AB541A|nr:TBC1 domain family member 17-like isoform X2 [Cuculus canorus]